VKGGEQKVRGEFKGVKIFDNEKLSNSSTTRESALGRRGLVIGTKIIKWILLKGSRFMEKYNNINRFFNLTSISNFTIILCYYMVKLLNIEIRDGGK
jgi:hypothetical protein